METDKRYNLYEQVYLAIKDAIVMGKLAPNQRLREMKLAEMFNTSRTPVREALRRLERERLVTLEPSVGAKVADLNKDTVTSVYECRSVLEGLAARKACNFIKKDDYLQLEELTILAREYFQAGKLNRVVEKNTMFHEKIVQLSRNPSLIQMMEHIRTEILRYRIMTSSVGFRPVAFDEHEAILQAIYEGNPDQAEELMRKHVLDDLDNFLNGLNQHHVNFKS
ncbi:GntR family transcriptional regulator [Bacillus litorisediminis]|uniref:GntR family transcriptional regulator n=1 Tax=Bacillus litorisediminis TaxID=2922713 RepID=UPI001FB0051A|nr:GntR family transcriptional regulator [Bacillus litorisediminis]